MDSIENRINLLRPFACHTGFSLFIKMSKTPLWLSMWRKLVFNINGKLLLALRLKIFFTQWSLIVADVVLLNEESMNMLNVLFVIRLETDSVIS